MSVDYDFRLVVGYRVTGKQLEERFGVNDPPKHRDEPRWDPKTGKPVEPERVVISWGKVALVYKDRVFETAQDLTEEIGMDVDSEIALDGCSMTDELDFIFGKPQLGLLDDGWDDGGHITIGPGFLLSSLDAQMMDRIKGIGEDLRELGLDPGPAIVTLAKHTY